MGIKAQMKVPLAQCASWTYFPYRLAKLARIEIQIYHLLKQFSQHHGQGPAVLLSYLKDVEQSSLRALMYQSGGDIAHDNDDHKDEDKYLYIGTHPLLIYRMIRRFSEDLPATLSKLNDNVNSLVKELYEKENVSQVVMPGLDDLHDALTSLSRIQYASNPKTDEFAEGKFEHVSTNISVNCLHALEIGAFYLEQGDYDLAVEWIYFGLKTLRENSESQNYPVVIPRFFETALEFAIEEHNKHWPQEQYKQDWKPGVYSTPISKPFRPESYTRMFDVIGEQARETKTRKMETWNWAIVRNFVSVCSGMNLQTKQEKAELKCWYERSQNLYWLINPLKVEALNINPTVLQIYEFIGDKFTTQIKQEAISNGLERSMVIDETGVSESIIMNRVRTSTQTWLYDAEGNGPPFLQQLTQKMEAMSRLIISPPAASDAFQVAVYGPSHHYAPHIDSFEDDTVSYGKGNRITTIMGYLNDVTAGGRTGFPVLGTFAEPVKGSVILWHNLKRNGLERDMRTWHGGCPVSLGVKWSNFPHITFIYH